MIGVPTTAADVNGWVAWLDSEITELDNSQDNWFCLERALLGLTNCPDKTTRTIDGNDIEGRYQSFIGNAMPWSPEYSATVTFEHNWYLHNGMRLSPMVSAHWQDEMFFDKGNFDEGAFHSGQDAFATADVALRLINEESAWAVELYVRNVTDEVTRSWADRGPGFMRASIGKPRHFGVKFNMAF